MNRGVSAIARLLTLCAGLITLACGIVALLWHVYEPVHTWIDQHWPTPDQVKAVMYEPLPIFIGMGAVAVFFILLNLSLLLRRHPMESVTIDGPQSGGAVHCDPTDIARAAARHLENQPDIEDASARTFTNNGQSTVDITLTSAAVTSPADLVSYGEQVTEDITAALGEDSPAIRVFLEYSPVRSSSSSALRSSAAAVENPANPD